MNSIVTPIKRETLIIVGNGMVGHHCVEQLVERGALGRYQVHVYGEERQRAYDRVHLSEYFGGRDAESLAMCEADYYTSTACRRTSACRCWRSIASAAKCLPASAASLTTS